jgi:cytochrome c
MKTIYAFLFVAFSTLLGTNLYAQNGTEAYFLGKWNATIKGTPNGDVTLPARFEKNGASLKGFYTDPESKEEKAMDTAYMDSDKLTFGFNIAGYDVTVTLAKKDDNTATGSLMGMFDVEAVRATGGAANGGGNAVEAYFMGKWNATAKGTPNGDVTIPVKFESKEGKLVGTFVDPESKQETAMSSVVIEGAALKMSFSVMGYDITITITKKDENTATGSLMDMFDVEAVRVK